jgi:uncharacterized protein
MADLSSLRARLHQPQRPAAAWMRRSPPNWVGSLQEGPHGRYFLVEECYRADHLHGGRALNDLLRHVPDPDGTPELPLDTALQRLVFLDTETTGLAGGTGTVAFLIGIGAFTEDAFRMRQYFLFDPVGEAQMLEDAITEVVASSGLVTFNGRQFDIPILQARSILRLRRMRAFENIPHLDLLPPARRFWRGRLESCALSSLESAVLGVMRSGDDVPGWEIPALYRDYLSRGDPQPLERVLYHNRQDVLSMVTLATEILSRFALSADEIQDAGDALAMARSLQLRGSLGRAEALYHAALRRADHPEDAFAGLSRLLKQTGRGAEAVPFWEAWADAQQSAWEPRVELAKHFEWRSKDLDRALAWAEQAESRAPNGHSEQKRLDRLARKKARAAGRKPKINPRAKRKE